MSKGFEEKNEHKLNSKSLPSMSSRQQILYLMKETQNVSNKEDDADSGREVLDYLSYFMKRKEKIRFALSRNVQLERAKFLKQSLKEFTHIKKNIYIDRKKYTFSDDDAYLCSCERKTVKRNEVEFIDAENSPLLEIKKEDEYFGCGKTCINKLVSAECVEHLCPAGISCRNRKFQQHLYSEVYPVKTENRGWGLCAGEFLPKGSFVMQYIGEIYSIDSEYGIGKLKEYKSKTCTYLMEISKKEVIDPTNKGNLARFINHSCEPNCETQKWHVLGEVCVGIFTLRDIKVGEEFTFNYGFNILKTTYQKCLCNTTNCKGYLGIVSQNEFPRGSDHSILCDICKVGCRNSEKVEVCENCKKVSHKNCVRKYYEKNNIIRAGGDNNNEKNFYICHLCVKKKNINIKEINGMSTINSMSALNLSANARKDKKSSQQLIKEFKSRNKFKTTNTEDSVSITESTENNNINLRRINDSEKVILIKKDSSNLLNTNSLSITGPIASNTNLSAEIVVDTAGYPCPLSNSKLKNEEEVEETTETIEVEETHLKKIRYNLKKLSNIGARLFWDYRQQSNVTNGIEIKITGTPIQIEKVKEQIQKLKGEKEIYSDYYSVTLNVPQIYVRKIIGHQNRNLISYKSKFNLEIDFNSNLMTDDIFPIYDTSQITIKGKENLVKSVENEIRKIIDNLKVVTVFLMPTDYNFIKMNICQLKTMVDPADMRLRKREYKIDREIKHSFYYVPCTNKDLVIIGFENEINKAQKIIREFLLRQNTLEPNYSLCFLCPVFFLNQVHRFQDDNSSILNKKNLLIKVYDPVFSRKHLNIYMEGKWKDIIEVKNQLMKFLNDNDKNSKKKNGLAEFVQYTYNQEHKLISKNLRNFFLEDSYIIKNWDLISDEVWGVWENNSNNALGIIGSGNNNNNNKNSNIKSGITSIFNNSNNNINKNINSQSSNLNPLMKNLLDGSNTDTMLNYLIHLPPGAYNSVFNLNKLDLTKDLIYYVEEAFESYKNRKKSEKFNSNEKTEKNESITPTPRSDVIITTTLNKSKSLDQENNKNEMIIDNEEDNFNLNLIINPNENYDVNMFENLTDNEDTVSVKDLPVQVIPIKIEVAPIIHKPQSIINSSPKIINNNNLSLFSDIDNIKNTLLNKLNEIKNEGKSFNRNYINAIVSNVNSNANSNDSVKSIDLSKNITATQKQNYEIMVSPEDLNMLLKKPPSAPISPAALLNSESMNISYNFSNINQMNININISSFPKDLMYDQANSSVPVKEGDNFGDEIEKFSVKGSKAKDQKFLRKKTKSERSLSPPYLKLEKHNSYYYNNTDKDKYSYNRDKDRFSNNDDFSCVRREKIRERDRERERERERDREKDGGNNSIIKTNNINRDYSSNTANCNSNRYYQNLSYKKRDFNNYNTGNSVNISNTSRRFYNAEERSYRSRSKSRVSNSISMSFSNSRSGSPNTGFNTNENTKYKIRIRSSRDKRESRFNSNRYKEKEIDKIENFEKYEKNDKNEKIEKLKDKNEMSNSILKESLDNNNLLKPTLNTSNNIINHLNIANIPNKSNSHSRHSRRGHCESRSNSLSSITSSGQFDINSTSNGNQTKQDYTNNRKTQNNYKNYSYLSKSSSNNLNPGYNNYKKSFQYTNYNSNRNFSSCNINSNYTSPKSYNNKNYTHKNIKTYYNNNNNCRMNNQKYYRRNFYENRRRSNKNSESKSPSRSNLKHLKEFLEIKKGEEGCENNSIHGIGSGGIVTEDAQCNQGQPVQLRSCLKKPAL